MGIIMQLAEQYLPPFLARKVKHATSGAVALLLPQQPTPIWVVALVAVTCVLVIVNESSGEKVLDDRSQTAPPLYGRGAGPMIQTGWWTHPDIGVCLFATSLVLCLLLQLPLTVLAPMLFADPAAAIAGRFYQTHYNRQPEETFRHPDATKSSKTQSSPYTGNPQNYIPPLRQSSSKSVSDTTLTLCRLAPQTCV
ncbi:hypothetical protein GNI_073840 [Gregarina niphandrodes]|uniref:Uncharacterized protein n=1 Tax=Gregarina niphandrodes TaxID=110365 RepID=A0A023B721_GRENI|nr:hypothetical protein GNI_073840 [Gregarina niphandrodes]EZG66928.1 hypothetical protein GNI_073840 [Gregarina niphandrodes]|eukprot:XP_011130418.1 hypothetical protein GNI_073840 [Gregarina niphandrodes]